MGFFKRDKESKNDKSLVEMTIDSIRPGYKGDDGRIIDLPEGVPFDYANHVCVVILKEIKGERYLPMWVDQHGAESISANLQLQYIAFKDLPRPMTHDFLCAIIRALGARVESVVVSELKNDCFYAITCLDCDGKSIKVDCCPSDAIAVAVRTGTPIFANEEVLREVGVRLDPITGQPIIEEV